MSGNPLMGFITGLGATACLFGLHACFCGGCGDLSPLRIPQGEFVLDEAREWSGEPPEEIRMAYDGNTFTLNYTAVGPVDDPDAAQEVGVNVVYRVVDLDVR